MSALHQLSEHVLAGLPPANGFEKGVVLVTGLSLALGAAFIGDSFGARQAALFLIGGLLGMTLYHASFGFAGGWRRFLVVRRSRALRAQMLMIAVAACAFIPLLSQGTFQGQALVGAFAPVGISVLIGAALFGLGMQLGAGCGSGTLFSAGGGSTRALVTLSFFIVGALVGSAHLPWWLKMPAIPPISLGAALGMPAGLGVTLLGLAAVAMVARQVEIHAHGRLETPEPASGTILSRCLRGPWPLLFAAVLLAGLNILTLILSGHPWSITFGFGLWGAKIAQGIGVPIEAWEFWTWPGPARALNGSVLADVTSVMNFGIMLGAALAAGIAGQFSTRRQLPAASVLAAIVGGLLMGYGARLSFGCNIGALFSGIASGSLHGWLWFAAAFTGSIAGIALRPLFGLDGFKRA